ncbi:MAG: outer membrane beta-barrel protein [Myxococcota bacterium]|nr:outer membrane beta-barrel protein [Myxococcota bacterium]
MHATVHTGYSKYLNDGPGGFGFGTQFSYPVWENIQAEFHLSWHRGKHTEKSEPNIFFETESESSTSALPIMLGASYAFPENIVSPTMYFGLGAAVLNTDIKLNGTSLKDNALFDPDAFKNNEINFALELAGGAHYNLTPQMFIGLVLGYTRIFTDPSSLEILSIHGHLGYAFK